MKMEYSRRQHAYELLPEHHRKYMPMDVWDKKQEEFMKCILANSRFLLWFVLFCRLSNRNVVKTRNYYTEMFGIPTHKRDRLSAPYQMSKVKSTLHQIVRDWSSEVSCLSLFIRNRDKKNAIYVTSHYSKPLRNTCLSIEMRMEVSIPKTSILSPAYLLNYFVDEESSFPAVVSADFSSKWWSVATEAKVTSSLTKCC